MLFVVRCVSFVACRLLMADVLLFDVVFCYLMLRLIVERGLPFVVC